MQILTRICCFKPKSAKRGKERIREIRNPKAENIVSDEDPA